ncbi:hypothetical protein [Sphingomonas sp. VNH70]|uniref:hypothetical protein n=1 Tax=Sphingomonas silueang TaxID=3156617 RepID=UPI0032B6236A
MKVLALVFVSAVSVPTAVPVLAQADKPISRNEFRSRQVHKYKQWDLDRNGVLPAEEILKARPRLPNGSANTLELAQAWVAARDGNGDGTLTIDEAVAFEMPRFDKMDADRDGRLSAQERASGVR